MEYIKGFIVFLLVFLSHFGKDVRSELEVGGCEGGQASYSCTIIWLSFSFFLSFSSRLGLVCLLCLFRGLRSGEIQSRLFWVFGLLGLFGIGIRVFFFFSPITYFILRLHFKSRRVGKRKKQEEIRKYKSLRLGRDGVEGVGVLSLGYLVKWAMVEGRVHVTVYLLLFGVNDQCLILSSSHKTLTQTFLLCLT